MEGDDEIGFDVGWMIDIEPERDPLFSRSFSSPRALSPSLLELLACLVFYCSETTRQCVSDAFTWIGIPQNVYSKIFATWKIGVLRVNDGQAECWTR